MAITSYNKFFNTIFSCTGSLIIQMLEENSVTTQVDTKVKSIRTSRFLEKYKTEQSIYSCVDIETGNYIPITEQQDIRENYRSNLKKQQ